MFFNQLEMKTFLNTKTHLCVPYVDTESLVNHQAINSTTAVTGKTGFTLASTATAAPRSEG